MMIKRVVVAGCRDYNNYEEAKKYIDFCLKNIKTNYNIIILSGGARGADALGERYAQEKGYTVERYEADWNKYGKAAGPKRNREMAQKADYIICFWNGKSRGTKSMMKFAKEYSKPLRVKFINVC